MACLFLILFCELNYTLSRMAEMESKEKGGGGTEGNPSVRRGGQLPLHRGAKRCPEYRVLMG